MHHRSWNCESISPLEWPKLLRANDVRDNYSQIIYENGVNASVALFIICWHLLSVVTVTSMLAHTLLPAISYLVVNELNCTEELLAFWASILGVVWSAVV